jgi:hypothetical protein
LNLSSESRNLPHWHVKNWHVYVSFFYHTKLCGKPYFVKILSNKNHDIHVQSVIIIITSACIASAGGQGVLCGVL